jgi:hypothetical protein
MAVNREAVGTAAGLFRVHRRPAFKGFEPRSGDTLVALCSCGATLDVAAARFRAALT